MKKINRQVYFYEVDLQKFNSENKSFEKSENYVEDLKNIFSKFDVLSADKENLQQSIYCQKNNGTYDFIKVDNIDGDYIEGKLVNSDDNGLTYYEEKGEIKFLKEVITEKASVAEVSHFIFFLDTNILAFEYNAKCSHAPSLSNYINEKTDHKYFIRFKNLLNLNKKKRFESLKKIRSFNFVASSKIFLTDETKAGGLFGAMESAFKIANNETDVEQVITIAMKPKRVTKKNKNPYYDATEIKNSIEELEKSYNEKDKLFKLDVVGYNELNEKIAVNYTNDIVTDGIKIDHEKSESKYIYEKLKESYNKIYSKYLK